MLPRVLEGYATSTSPDIRRILAARTDLPDLVLDALSVDPSLDVRTALSINPTLSAAHQLTLAADPDLGLRRFMAAHAPSLTLDVQRLLARDTAVHPELASSTRLDPGVAATLAASSHAFTLERLASNPTITLEIAWTLSRDQRSRVRTGLSSNPTIPAALQEVLAADAVTEVRLRLAANPALAPKLQEGLFRDPEPSVVAALVSNPNLVMAPYLPVSVMLRSLSGREHLAAALADLDPDTSLAITATFTGTLEELRVVLEDFDGRLNESTP